MKQSLTLAFIGGDLRQVRAIYEFAAEGYITKISGFDKYEIIKNDYIHISDNIKECISKADVIILPLPYSIASGEIYCPFSSEKIYVSELIGQMNTHQLLLAGKADKSLMELSALHNIHIIDYLNREEMSVLNTIPTVEGAIEIAMSETPYTIHGSKCLVLGHGRIGKLLSHNLRQLGAEVYVAARKHSDLAWIKAYGNTPVPFINALDAAKNCNIIFNTIPIMFMDYMFLSEISKECLIIDLASRPGGVDFNAAGELGMKVISALSLPGKVAPDTAGSIVKDTIVNILEELEV